MASIERPALHGRLQRRKEGGGGEGPEGLAVPMRERGKKNLQARKVKNNGGGEERCRDKMPRSEHHSE